jgi:uncharacterized membrane protein YbhN (UPF0104 family)
MIADRSPNPGLLGNRTDLCTVKWRQDENPPAADRAGPPAHAGGWAWVRTIGAAAALALVIWRVGTGAFTDGLRSVDGRALAAAVVIGFVTTACSAWRWTVVARLRGLRLSFPAALAAYYRSMFLNLTLPGGIVGDVHRGVSHGRSAGTARRGLLTVAWERGIGQLVQIAVTIAVLLVLPSPVHAFMPFVLVAAVAAAVAAVVARRRRPFAAGSAALTRWEALGIAVASLLAVLGYAAMFVIAAQAAGIAAPMSRMMPLALLAVTAMVLPSIAGWGPREGVTAWAFGAAGLGAGAGVSAAVVYGVMALAASLPGAVLLAAGWTGSARSLRLFGRRGGALDA